MQVLLRWLRLNKIARILSAANPAEIIMRVLQQIIWQLLVILKSTGSTLINVTVSLGRVHKVLEGPCRKACARVDPLADSLERLGACSAPTRRSPRTSPSSSSSLTLALCIALRRHAGPSVSPVRRALPRAHVAPRVAPRRVSRACARARPKPSAVKINRRRRAIATESARKRPRGTHLSTQHRGAGARAPSHVRGGGGNVGGVGGGDARGGVGEEEEGKRRGGGGDGTRVQRTQNGHGEQSLTVVAHAANRAPTRADHEHATRVRQLIRPTRVGEGA